MEQLWKVLIFILLQFLMLSVTLHLFERGQKNTVDVNVRVGWGSKHLLWADNTNRVPFVTSQ